MRTFAKLHRAAQKDLSIEAAQSRQGLAYKLSPHRYHPENASPANYYKWIVWYFIGSPPVPL
jgi:hypothetical protein